MEILKIITFLAISSLTWALPRPAERLETDPELTAGFIEGDMVLDMNTRNGLRDEIYRWPNNTVYYKFHTKFDDEHKNHILLAMETLQNVSCIRFQEVTKKVPGYIKITGYKGGCYSSVGYLKKGPQLYNLQLYPLNEGCFRLGSIVHEFLHTLGFFHMQSAANRNDYVHIVRQNIIKGMESNFNKFNSSMVDNFDQEYDYGSVLHYSAYAFSANGKKTIVPLKDKDAARVMGQRKGMSQSDIARLNVMYRCQVKI